MLKLFVFQSLLSLVGAEIISCSKFVWYARAAMPVCSRPLSFRRSRWTIGFACQRRVLVDLQHALDEVELISAFFCERDEVGLQRAQFFVDVFLLFEVP